MPAPVIQTRGLGKVFRARAGAVVAVQDLDLCVPEGEIFGLLGPNGAGKTTTVRMLCGLVRPSSGSASIDGFSVTDQADAVRSRIGLVPEDAGDHKNLSLIEELEYHGALYGMDHKIVHDRARPLIERLGLTDRRKHRLKTFSKGMRRKFHLIRALLHEPRVLLLDEPTAGLDPAVVEEVWDLLKTLTTQRHITVILCSHHLEEVEKLCDRVAIIRQRLLVEGPLSELSGGHRRYRISLTGDASPFLPLVNGQPGIAEASADQAMLRLRFSGDGREIMPQVIQRLVHAGAGIIEAGRDGQDLRSLYKSAVGNGGNGNGGGESAHAGGVHLREPGGAA